MPLCDFLDYVSQEIAAFIVIRLYYFEEGVSEFLRSAGIHSTMLYGVSKQRYPFRPQPS
jgi:hypothetical protein